MTYEGHDVEETHGHVTPEMGVVKWFRKLIEPLKYGTDSVQKEENVTALEETPEQEEKELAEAENASESFTHLGE